MFQYVWTPFASAVHLGYFCICPPCWLYAAIFHCNDPISSHGSLNFHLTLSNLARIYKYHLVWELWLEFQMSLYEKCVKLISCNCLNQGDPDPSGTQGSLSQV